MAFYQKYRSKQFSELIGQDHISLTLIQAIKSNKLAHAYLLTGPRGTGKTSTARLLAKAINCQDLKDKFEKNVEISGEVCDKCDSCQEISDGRSVDVIEIDAASHTGVDDIRDLIDKSRFAPVKSPKKIYIIDEVHMLSKSAFNALLKTLEEPPAHVVFILATTEVNKLPATILSRTQRYDFKRVSKQDIIKNLTRIAKNEKIDIAEDALEIIAVAADGGHRDAVGLFEQVASFSKNIKREDVENILGVSRLEDRLLFVRAIFNNNPEEGLKIAHRLYDDGTDVLQFTKDIIEILRKILLLKVSSKLKFDDITDEAMIILKDLSSKPDRLELTNLIHDLVQDIPSIKEANMPLLPLEMTLVRYSKIKNVKEEVFPSLAKDIINTVKEDKEPKSHKKAEKKEEKAIEKPEPEDSEMIAAPVIEMTLDLWQKIIEEAKKANTSLAALLRDAKPIKISDDTIAIGVKFGFHKDRISDPKNRSILEKIVNSITGKKYLISCELLERKKPSSKIKGDDNLEKAAEEIFS